MVSAPSYRSDLLSAQGDVFRVEVFADALGPALAADAGCFDPAERCGGVGDDALVETDHPDVERLRDADRPVQIGGGEATAEGALRGACPRPPPLPRVGQGERG